MARFKNLINEFLDQIKNLNREEMLKTSIAERERIQNEVKENRHDHEKEYFQVLLRYYVNLKGLVHFLEHEECHPSLYPGTFKRFEWIAVKLIKKGEMEERVLEVF